MGENEKNGDLQKATPKNKGESRKEDQKKNSESNVLCSIAIGIGALLAFLFLFLSYFSKGESLWVSILGFAFILFNIYTFASYICKAGLEKFYIILLIEAFLIIAVVGYIFLPKNICGCRNQTVITLIFSLGGTIIGAVAASIKDVLELIKEKSQAQKGN